MSEYITDPGLLSQLNKTEYVSDPTLLAKLNGEEPAVNFGDYASVQAGMSAARPYAQAAYDLTGGMRDAANIAKNLVTQVGPEGLKEIVTHPVQTAKAYLGGHPAISQGLRGMTSSGVSKVLSPLASPENLLTLPYTMSAYEQEKIRQNPDLPQYQNNPYAQAYRGEAQTPGRAAAANQMKATANMPFGNVTPEERALLEEDARMKSAIRKKAFEKVMGPVAPGSF